MNSIRYIYFGSSRFSRIILEGLRQKDLPPQAVVTRPDKPKGRGLKTQPTEISLMAKAYEWQCLKPVSLKDSSFQEILPSFNADFFLIADYGAIIPETLITIPKIMALCVHPSLLPVYRGASPIESSLLNGDASTGVTIFKVNERVDAGDILLQQAVSVEEDDDHCSLLEKTASVGVTLLSKALDLAVQGRTRFVVQDEAKARQTHKINKSDASIIWQEKAFKTHNKIRAFCTWPKAYTFYKGKLIQIISSEIVLMQSQSRPGEVVKIGKDGVYVACGENALKIKSLKPEGKKEMSAWAFVCGHHLKEGELFSACSS